MYQQKTSARGALCKRLQTGSVFKRILPSSQRALRWRPFSDSLVIARNIWDARRVSRILARETALLEQVNPLDAFLDEEDDLFGFDEDI